MSEVKSVVDMWINKFMQDSDSQQTIIMEIEVLFLTGFQWMQK